MKKFLFYFWALPSFSQEISILQNIESDLAGENLIVTLKFEKPHQIETSLEEHGSFWQMKLPNTLIPDGGHFWDVLPGFPIKKIATYQINSTDALIRFFLEGEVQKEDIFTDFLPDRMLITVKKKVEPISNLAPLVEIPQEKSLSGLDRLTKSLEPFLANFSPILWVKVLSFFSFLLFCLIWLLKRRQDVSSPEISLKILSSLVLAPKEKLILVQIGSSERILLGVSSRGMELIKDFSFKKTSYPIQEISSVRPNFLNTSSPSPSTSPSSTSSSTSSNHHPTKKTEEIPSSHQAISDITQMIRQKLKDLPGHS